MSPSTLQELHKAQSSSHHIWGLERLPDGRQKKSQSHVSHRMRSHHPWEVMHEILTVNPHLRRKPALTPAVRSCWGRHVPGKWHCSLPSKQPLEVVRCWWCPCQGPSAAAALQQLAHCSARFQACYSPVIAEQLHSVQFNITTAVDLGVLFIHLPSHKFPSWTP